MLTLLCIKKERSRQKGKIVVVALLQFVQTRPTHIIRVISYENLQAAKYTVATAWLNGCDLVLLVFRMEEDIGLSVGAAWIAGQDRSMWRTLRPSAGQAQQ